MALNPFPRLPNAQTRQHHTDYAGANCDKQQHGCLSLWLAGMFIFALWALAQILSALPLYSRTFGTFASYVLVGTLIAEMMCVIGIVRWKRWGVYGLGLAVLINFCLRVTLRILVLQTLLAFVFALFML